MILPIFTYGNSVLRKDGNHITNKFKELDELVNNMFETLHNSDGVGLAAHQIGKPLSLFVIDFKNSSMEPDGIKKVFINPEIIKYSDELDYFGEGCLSIPGIEEEIKRPKSITIKYLDENFTEHIEDYDDILSRIIQHEYNHTRGILFIDKLPPLKKKILSKKIKMILNKKFYVNYKTK